MQSDEFGSLNLMMAFVNGLVYFGGLSRVCRSPRISKHLQQLWTALVWQSGSGQIVMSLHTNQLSLKSASLNHVICVHFVFLPFLFSIYMFEIRTGSDV